MIICSLFGHADFQENKEIKIKFIETIKQLIINHHVDTFYMGDKGNFDNFCAKTMKEVKQLFPFINNCLVLSYYNFKKNDEDLKFYYDEIIYPPLENVPKIFAINRRNKFMIDNSQYVVFYVNYIHNISKFLEYTKKKKIPYINLGKL